MNYYSKDASTVCEELDTSINGLSKEKADKLLNKYGLNEMKNEKQESVFKLFLSQFASPMEIILVIIVFLSFFIGEIVDAIALLIIIFVDVIVGTIEEWKAKKDADSLISMIKVKAHVIRNQKKQEIDAKNLVVGDIMILESGDKISADARIIECHNFSVNESSLTGESVAVVKTNDVLSEDTILAERTNMVYAGTTVMTGRCACVVVATAYNTEIGKIADKVTNTKEEKSPLTIRMEKFTKQISVMIIVIAIIIFIVLYFKDYQLNEIFFNVIALSVSAMPEGLSLALTMALTIASKKMAKENVIVKKLNAVESLGSCTVIASDKTGTLTVNEQTAKMIILKDGSHFQVTGTGYNDNGKVTGDGDIEDAKKIGFLGLINNEALLENDMGAWKYFGDSIDIAFLSLAMKLDIKNEVKIVDRIPYESENQFSAVYYEKDGKLYCTVKGSLEKVMFFSENSEVYKKHNDELTSNGYRVIALANGVVSDTSKESLKDLEFVGMVGFIDPIREDVKASIKECMKAGIKVVMITGDHPATAYAIAKELGLCEDYNEVATGSDVDSHRELGDEEFDKYISCIKVFSRVTPMDKLDIVNSFKRQGEFIAVTGDGVNDAPAIKSANIGISMGSGTDVAKETASMIITDDSFTSIVSGIKEGRTAYNNIRKITLFLISCGLAEVLFFVLSIIFGYDIPLIAIQLLWLNLVTDGLQDISLSFEKAERDIMNIPPRKTNESLFSKDLVTEIIIQGVTITLVVFGIWKYLMDKNTDIVLARSIIMTLMVFIQNVNVLNCCSEKKSIFKINVFNNPLIILTIVSSIILQIIVLEVPFFSKFLGIVPLDILTMIKLFGISLIIIFVFEIYKVIYNKIKKSNK